MNFLQIVNRTRQECAAAGSALTTLQSNMSAESQRFMTWVNEAFRDIQQHKPDWQWMRKNFSFPTVAGQAGYTLAQMSATDMADWKRDSVRAYATAVGTNDEQILPFMEFTTWRNVYAFGVMRASTGRPSTFTINPDKSLSIGPLPSTVYTVTGEYYRAPADMSADLDDPSAAGFNLPVRYHMLIVYRAMQSYARFYAAPEVMAFAIAMSDKHMRRLEFEFLPMLINGPPLA